MALFEFIKDRKRKAVLFFLTGFFSGGILYFLCNDAAADLYEELWQNIKNWMREESPFLSNFLYSLWKRGKVAFIIFLAGNTRWNKNVFRAFVVWEGAKAGFFMTIFCHSMGVRGFFSCVAMGIPHMFLFLWMSGEEKKVQNGDHGGLFCLDSAWLCRAGGGGAKSDARFAIVHILVT